MLFTKLDNRLGIWSIILICKMRVQNNLLWVTSPPTQLISIAFRGRPGLIKTYTVILVVTLFYLRRKSKVIHILRSAGDDILCVIIPYMG